MTSLTNLKAKLLPLAEPARTAMMLIGLYLVLSKQMTTQEVSILLGGAMMFGASVWMAYDVMVKFIKGETDDPTIPDISIPESMNRMDAKPEDVYYDPTEEVYVAPTTEGGASVLVSDEILDAMIAVKENRRW